MAGQLSKGVELSMRAAGTTGSYTKIENLQEFPDIFGEPENVDVTTLDNDYRHYIPGIKDVGGTMTFVCLYTKAGFTAVQNAEDTHQDFKLSIPASTAGGSDGMEITWSGFVTASLIGKGVNDALQFNVNVTADEDFEVQ